MKTKTFFFLLLITLFGESNLLAQVPQGFNYQAILRDAADGFSAQVNTQVFVTFKILEFSPSENVLYAEDHGPVITNSIGLVNLTVGGGLPIDGFILDDFGLIDWGNGIKFLQVWVRFAAGDDPILLGQDRLLSVPYALYAQRSGTSLNAGDGIAITNNVITNVGDTDPTDDLTTDATAGGDLSGVFSDLQIEPGAVASEEIADGSLQAQDLSPMGASAGQVLKWDGTGWLPAADELSAGGGSYTGGPGIEVDNVNNIITNTGDTDAGNELQELQLNGVELNLTQSTQPPIDLGFLQTTYEAGTGIELVGTTIENTGDTDATDDLTATTVFGGDVSGPFDDLQIEPGAVASEEIADGSLQAQDLSPMGASAGQVLKWDGTGWLPAADELSAGGGSYTGGPGIEVDNVNNIITNTGDVDPDNELQELELNGVMLNLTQSTQPPVDLGFLQTTYTQGTGIAIQGTTIENTGDTDPSDDLTDQTVFDGDVAGVSNDLQIEPGAVGSGEIADGSVDAQDLSPMGASAGQVLKWDGTGWAPAADELATGGSSYTGGSGIEVDNVNNIITNTGDIDPDNELQELELNGVMLNLTQSTQSPVDLGFLQTTYTQGTGIAIQGTTIENTGDTDPSDDLTDQTVFDGDVAGVFNDLQIEPGAVGSGEIADGSVDSQDLAAMGAGDGQVLKWNGTGWAPAADELATGGSSYTGGSGIEVDNVNNIITNTGDTDPDNELQELELNGVMLNLTQSTQSPVDLGFLQTTYTQGTGIAIQGTTIENTGDTDPSDDLTDQTVFDGDVAGVFNDLQIEPGAVGSGEIADGSVDSQDLAAMGAGDGQVLKWNGSAWGPGDDTAGNLSSGPGINITGSTIINTGDTDPDDDLTVDSNAGGDVVGNWDDLEVQGLSGRPIGGMSDLEEGEALIYKAGAWQYLKAEGDVSGRWDSLSVGALLGRPIGGMSDLEEGEALIYKDGAWQYLQAEGDVSGRWDSLSVGALLGRPIGGMSDLEEGEALIYKDGAWQYLQAEGDVSGRWDSLSVGALLGRPIGGMSDLEEGEALIYKEGAWQYLKAEGDVSGRWDSLSVQKLAGIPVGADMGSAESGKALIITGSGPDDFQYELGSVLNLPLQETGSYSQPILDLEHTGCCDIGLQVRSSGNHGIKGISEEEEPNFSSFNELDNPNFQYPAGVYGESITSPNFSGAGVMGRAVSSNDNHGIGGWFQGNSIGSLGVCYDNGVAGVVGYSKGGSYGGLFLGDPDDTPFVSSAVFGDASGADFGGFFEGPSSEPNNTLTAGIYARAIGADWGAYIIGTSDQDGGLFVGNNGASKAAVFQGDVMIIGTLNKSEVGFKIDHPEDPANKYLVHSAVESPDMKTLYDGLVVTDEEGYATVDLPPYFESLNRDFRYHLTVIGTFAQAIVAEKIQNNQFVIRTDQPQVEVSWQVTGIRKDPYAEAHPYEAEIEKAGNEKGKYLHPELYGMPDAQGIYYFAEPELSIEMLPPEK